MSHEENSDSRSVADAYTTRRIAMMGAGAMGLAAMLQQRSPAQANQDASPEAAQTPVKVVVLYAMPDDPAAFDEYYLNTHLPMARQIPGYQRLESARVIATADASPSPYHRVTELVFPSMDAMEGGLVSPEGQAALADQANFASAGFVTLITEIDVSETVGATATRQP